MNGYSVSFSAALNAARGLATFVAPVVIAFVTAAAGVAQAGDIGASSGPVLLAQAAPRPSAASLQAELDALIKAGKAEGEILWYSAATENVAKRVSAAFTAKYGIKAPFVRIGGVQILTRFAAEAESNNFASDLVFNSGDVVNFAEDGIKKGWIESISLAGLPVLKGGEFPARMNLGPTAIVQIAPWMLAYNSEKLKGADIPKDWPELLNPKFKGQIIAPGPRSSDAYIAFWALLYDRYGDSFFAQLRAQNPRLFDGGGTPAVNALAAGEGSVMLPVVPGLVQGLVDSGAPLKMVPMEFTTGIEMQLFLTARSKARHPNAARLFANYVLSPEGNKVFNDDPGGVTVYDTSRLPARYQSPKPGIFNRRDEMAKLFGR